MAEAGPVEYSKHPASARALIKVACIYLRSACWETFLLKIKEHLNLEHTIVLKQSICMLLIAKRPIFQSEKFINFLYLWKKPIYHARK